MAYSIPLQWSYLKSNQSFNKHATGNPEQHIIFCCLNNMWFFSFFFYQVNGCLASMVLHGLLIFLKRVSFVAAQTHFGGLADKATI